MIQLRVDGEVLDLYETELIAQTFAINNFNEIENRNGSGTNSFTIPITTKNRRLLGYPDDINITDEDNGPYTKIDCDILEDGFVIKMGFLQVTISSKDFEVTFYSDNTQWFDLIKDKPLSDIDLSEYDHTYNSTDVFASKSNTTGYIYAPIDYGTFIDRIINNATDIVTTDLFPSIYVHNVVKKIFSDAGYKVAGSFIDDNVYNKLVLPFVNKTFVNLLDHTERLYKATWSVNTALPSASFVQIKPDFEDFDGSLNNYNLALGRYVADSPQSVVFKGDFQLSAPGTSGTILVELYKNGLQIGGNTHEFVYDVGSCPLIKFRFNPLDLQAGDYVTMQISNSVNNWEVLAGTYWQNEVTQEILLNGTVNLSPNLPKIKQDDLIRTLANQFTLLFYTDDFTKTVYIEKFEKVYKNIPNAKDWSDKLDLSETPEIEFTIGDYGKKNNFKYKEDSSDTDVEEYNSDNLIPFGDGQLVLDNEFLEEETDIIELEFAPTMCIDSFTGGDSKLYLPSIPKDNSDAEPRMLICLVDIGVDVLSSGTAATIFYVTGSPVNVLPFCFFIKEDLGDTGLDGFIDSLAFDIPEGHSGQGLIETNYKFVKRVINNPKVVRARFRLKPKDILELDFTYPVYVKKYNSYFYINAVNEYTGGHDSTEVELLKL